MTAQRFCPLPERTASSVWPPVVAGAPAPRGVSGASSRISASAAGVNMTAAGAEDAMKRTEHAAAAVAAIAMANRPRLMDSLIALTPALRNDPRRGEV